MANLGFNFNPAQFEPLNVFILTPKGEWNAVVKDTKVDTEKQDQPKLVVTFEIIEGSCKGASLDLQLALWTPDDAAKKGGGWGAISRRKLRSLTDALGIHGEFNDSAVLHGKPVTLTTDLRFVSKTNAPGEYAAFPDIKKFSPYVGQGRAAGADAVQPTPPAANVGGASAAAPQLPQMGASALPTLPQMGNFAPPAAPPVATQQAPAQMPQGFQMPGQQTAPMAPPPGMPPMGMQMPQMGGFAPPAAPAGMPAFQAPPMGGPGPWAGGAPR